MRFTMSMIPAALLGLLVAAAPAEAQRRGRNNGPLPNNGVGRYINPIINPNYNNGYYNNGYYNNGYYNNGYGRFNNGYYNNGYYNTPYRSFYYYSDVQPQTQYQYQAQYPSFSYDEDAHTKAWLTVRVPADAKVWIDGSATEQSGTMRDFITPPLENGGVYHLKATWTENGKQVERKRDVRVQPGQHSMVDFMASRGSEERVNEPEVTRPSTTQPRPARDNDQPDSDDK